MASARPWNVGRVLLVTKSLPVSGSVRTPVSSTKPGAPKLSLAPLSISRSGNNITLSGSLPDDSAKAALIKSLKDALGPGVNVVDQIKIDPSVNALDFSKAGPLFTDSASITDFNLTVNVDTVTLAGTAASTDQKNSIAQAATHIWSWSGSSTRPAPS